jgi:HAD superfamily phosphatase
VKDLLIFDMDGVLVDVNESYRATIQATVKHFTGYEPSREEIQDWKNRGGWNDDWQLSTRMIQERGGNTSYEEVVDYFQMLFQGKNSDGLILREKWLAADGLFQRLGERHHLAVFTGRLRWEAHVTLDRFLPGLFDPVIGADDVVRTKPDPEGIHKIRSAVPHRKSWYIGDTVDDARASSRAGVPFIGIAAKSNPRYTELVELLRAEGAVAVLDDINSLEAAIASDI